MTSKVEMYAQTADNYCDEIVPDELLCSPEKVKRQREDVKEVLDLTRVFKALSDENRLKIIYSLSKEGELCVCDIAGIINSSIQRASYHLRLLRSMGLCAFRKEGKISYYRLKDNELSNVILSFMNKR